MRIQKGSHEASKEAKLHRNRRAGDKTQLISDCRVDLRDSHNPPHVFNGIRNNATSAIITPPDGSHDALIEKNFLAGGAYTLYCPGNSSVNVRILNNTFAHTPGPLGAAFGYLDGCNAATLSGNVTDQGDPVTP